MLSLSHLTLADLHPQFIVSKIVTDAQGVVHKYPCNPQGNIANHKDPANWLTYEKAREIIAKLGADYRLGYSITRETMLFLLDIDKACDNGTWSELASKLYNRAKGCLREISQSGRGMHILARYKGDLPPFKNKNTAHNLEFYTHDRFVMFGEHYPDGDWNFDATDFVHEVIGEFFHVDNPQAVEAPVDTIDIDPVASGLVFTDELVIARCRAKPSPRAEFGNGVSFSQLFDGDFDAIAIAYPPKTEGKAHDGSAADQALANMISWQTIDGEQIERIMRMSALTREKWDNHKTYLPKTIHKTILGRNAIYYPHAKQSNGQATVSQEAGGLTDLSDMPQEYQDCYYVLGHKKTYSIRFADLLTKEMFDMCYTTPICETPYKAFKKHASTTGHILNLACFKPELGHGQILEEEDLRMINIYKPFKPKMREGDMTPFFNFFDKMIPNKRDQRILFSYAAALVQNPGLKAMWCPVIQGVEGCGKSFFADLVARVVGEKYTHRAKSSELESNFSGQWFAKLLMLIEDVSLKHSKLEDVLKPLITAKRYAFELKGCDIFMGDFPLNFIITANNVDIIKKEEETRRYSFLMCAQQTRTDRIEAGFTNAYFENLAKWRDNGGQAFFAHFLHNYTPDPEFDFSKGCCTAPDTSTTAKAIEANRSDAELLIQEAIESGRAGFKGAFISSTMLTRLFQENSRSGIHLPNNLRSHVLKKLGYELHPQLANGRASRVLQPDGNQPKLYVKIGHVSSLINNKELVMKAYEDAQK